MKKYLKYRNFIPLDFINKKSKEEKSSDRVGVIALLILNFALLPINFENLFYDKEKETFNFIEEDRYSYFEVCNWLELKDLSIEHIRVCDGLAEVIIKDKSTLKEIEDKGFLVKKIKIEDGNIIVNLKGDIIYEERQ